MNFIRRFCSLIFILHVSIAYGDPSEAPIWGTYRPHALTSIRARVPHSPTFGFIYHSIYDANLRHLASDRTEDIRSFSWRRHDGLDFGEHHVEDTRLNLRITTHFVRSPETHSWALRFSGEALLESLPTKPISTVFYAAAGAETRSANSEKTSFKTSRVGGRVDIHGKDGAVGDFLVSIQEPTKGSIESVGKSVEKGATDASHTRLRKRSDGLESKIGGLARYYTNGVVGEQIRAWTVENHLAKKFSDAISEDAENLKSMPLRMKDEKVNGAQTAFVQRILQAPFSLDVVFQDITSGSKDSTVFKDPASVTKAIDAGLSSFDAKFDQVFGLRDLGAEETELAKVSLSNVLGGIGYWHGQSISEDPGSQHGMKELDPVNLLTATPSRATFPRGFLWDEGFHQLIVQKWNAKLSSECLQSWFSMIQPNGWIPREQILGIEARSRFPQHIQHLVVQKTDIANPPTLLMPLRVLAAQHVQNSTAPSTDAESCSSDGDDEGVCKPLKKASPDPPNTFLVQATRKLKDYFEYVRLTQSGEDDDTFRWRGRSNDQKPGKGNYPLTLASGLDDYPRALEADASERHVDLHAWIAWAAGTLAEMARATDSQSDYAHFSVLHERLVKSLREKYYSSSSNLLCDHTGTVANCHEGYVTLLPFALGLLSPDDVLVSSALDALESDSRLRSPAGVRSLSAEDSAYRQGDDYWTGPVWMPFNFLTLAALKTKYSAVDGPYRERSLKVYKSLRRSVLDNALRVFKDTGYLWENYDPEDGSGRRGRQFTGWTALILLIYSEMYEGVVA